MVIIQISLERFYLFIQIINLRVDGFIETWHIKATHARKLLTTKIMLEQKIIYIALFFKTVVLSG